jgi:branched-chain amino acid transport system ATP-binding protein
MSHLELRDIVKRFGTVEVLQKVSMSVELGTVTGLIGPNGAGKSTLANIVSGYVRADGGRVRIGGRDVTSMPVHRRARLGVGRTFQNLELFDGMTVTDNVVVGRYGSRRAPWLTGPGRRDRQYAGGVLADVALADSADVDAGALSFGQAKMVEPARVVATEPSLVVMDEPAAGLTADRTAGLGRWLRDFTGPETAVLLIEHNMSLVMSVADYIYVLDHGVLIGEGTPDEVRANPAVVAAYLGTGDDT